MQIEKRAGQLFMVGFQGATVTPKSQIIKDIKQYNLGGVILFDRLLARNRSENNILSPKQVKRLTEALQNTAQDSLLIAVDQEGGRVSRFSEQRGFPTTLSAERLSEAPLTATIEAAAQTAQMLSEAGCTINLAPVVDINSTPTNPVIGAVERSFGHDATTVANYAAAWIREHHRHGIHCCLKHFPGHGSSKKDSHHGFVDITKNWQPEELVPYQILQKKGLIDAVMTGHLYNKRFDKHYPATLSRPTLTLLRDHIGFHGPVLSDDMQMRAITDHYGFDEGICLALAAGVDLIVVGNNLDYDQNIVKKLINAVIKGLDYGLLTEQRIIDAAKRVALLRTAP